MLVLSRQENEVIRIGDSIEITVIRIDRNRVRIGISAPREVTVMRAELMPSGVEPIRAVAPEISSTPPEFLSIRELTPEDLVLGRNSAAMNADTELPGSPWRISN